MDTALSRRERLDSQISEPRATLAFLNKATTICARFKPRLKSKVEGILSLLGPRAFEIIQALYQESKRDRGKPVEGWFPNALVARIAQSSMHGKNVKRFGGAKELSADLR